MKIWETRIVPVSLVVSSMLFLVAALKPVMADRPVNAAFLAIGVLCLILGIATWKKGGNRAVPPSA